MGIEGRLVSVSEGTISYQTAVKSMLGIPLSPTARLCTGPHLAARPSSQRAAGSEGNRARFCGRFRRVLQEPQYTGYSALIYLDQM